MKIKNNMRYVSTLLSYIYRYKIIRLTVGDLRYHKTCTTTIYRYSVFGAKALHRYQFTLKRPYVHGASSGLMAAIREWHGKNLDYYVAHFTKLI